MQGYPERGLNDCGLHGGSCRHRLLLYYLSEFALKGLAKQYWFEAGSVVSAILVK